jgi:hypothetical protein
MKSFESGTFEDTSGDQQISKELSEAIKIMERAINPPPSSLEKRTWKERKEITKSVLAALALTNLSKSQKNLVVQYALWGDAAFTVVKAP